MQLWLLSTLSYSTVLFYFYLKINKNNAIFVSKWQETNFIFCTNQSRNYIMDKILKYEKIILDISIPYANIRYSNIDAHNELIADKENNRYNRLG